MFIQAPPSVTAVRYFTYCTASRRSFSLRYENDGIELPGIPRVIVGENLTFMGEEELLRNRGVQLEVVNDARCVELMREFIRTRPALWNEDIGE